MEETKCLTVELTDSTHEFIVDQAADQGYPTPGDYVLALIEEARRQKAVEHTETLLMEGLTSGPPIEATPEYWERKRSS